MYINIYLLYTKRTYIDRIYFISVYLISSILIKDTPSSFMLSNV